MLASYGHLLSLSLELDKPTGVLVQISCDSRVQCTYPRFCEEASNNSFVGLLTSVMGFHDSM